MSEPLTEPELRGYFESGYKPPEQWQVLRDDAPQNVVVDLVVAVNQPIPEGNDLGPRHIRER